MENVQTGSSLLRPWLKKTICPQEGAMRTLCKNVPQIARNDVAPEITETVALQSAGASCVS